MFSQPIPEPMLRRWRSALALSLALASPAQAGAADWLAHVRSTDSTIFYHNLDDSVATLERKRQRAPLSDGDAVALAQLLYLRGQLSSDVTLMDAALALLRLLPNTAAVRAQQATIALSLHRFDEAAALLAQTAGPQAAALQAELWWNRGSSSAAWQRLDQLLEGSRNPLLYTRKAAWLMEQGRFDLAQAQLELARASLVDPHPLPAAWLYLGKARLLSAQDKHDEAYRLLLSAQERLPRFVPLLEALAMAQAHSGDRAGAADRLRLAISLSPDPHLPVQLAKLLPAEQRGPWLLEAELRFAGMMLRFPQVYAAEAAQFYNQQGRHAEAAQALALLPARQRGLHDWVLAASIEVANGRRQEALDALQAARGSSSYAWKQYCQMASLYNNLLLPDQAAAVATIVINHGSRPCPTANYEEET